MRSKLLILSTVILLLDLAVLLVSLQAGSTALSIFLIFSSFAIFGSGFIWLIAREDDDLHIIKPLRVIPLLLWGGALFLAFEKAGTKLQVQPEALSETGLMLGSRYLVGVWIVSVVILATFLTLVSISRRGSQ